MFNFFKAWCTRRMAQLASISWFLHLFIYLFNSFVGSIATRCFVIKRNFDVDNTRITIYLITTQRSCFTAVPHMDSKLQIIDFRNDIS